MEVTGTVRTESGAPVRGGLLEIWNANHFGRYRHIEDHSGLQLDDNFFGMGRVLTDDDGNYRFWTISPGAYLARPDIGRWRPKHIHISVSGGSSRLVTQMYFPDEPNNATDPMAILMGDGFKHNVGKPYGTPDQNVDEGFRFDIVVGGRNATFLNEGSGSKGSRYCSTLEPTPCIKIRSGGCARRSLHGPASNIRV
ncbi:hypothetical protein QTO30_13350 [Yoonia sp. GPGPB17]|uniref:dioxygenase family protein n=1 Tax=Yoonia sp. GPGPB17 TaxID=3026147 RepID=UPI0030BDF30D